eukprot:9631450-Karenia_brevis.AAC.1
MTAMMMMMMMPMMMMMVTMMMMLMMKFPSIHRDLFCPENPDNWKISENLRTLNVFVNAPSEQLR